MNKFLMAATALALTTACADAPAKKPVSDTLRSKAERAFCGLDYEMFKAEKEATPITPATFKALKENVINEKDTDAVKEEKAKKNGVYKLTQAEIFKFVYGKETPTSVHTEGSVKVKFNAENGWNNGELAAEQLCDTLNTASQSGPHQKPGPGKYVKLKISGVEQFEIPAMVVKSKFESQNEGAKQKPMSPSTIETLPEPGDDVKNKVSRNYYTLKDGGIMMIEYTERPTSILVVRATYKKKQDQ